MIDNVHSAISRIRGFHGVICVNQEKKEVVLFDRRTRKEWKRWRIQNISRVFCPKTMSKKDKNKILVLITKRSE